MFSKLTLTYHSCSLSANELQKVGSATAKAWWPNVLKQNHNQWKLMASRRSQMLLTDNLRDWYTIVKQVLQCSLLEELVDSQEHAPRCPSCPANANQDAWFSFSQWNLAESHHYTKLTEPAHSTLL